MRESGTLETLENKIIKQGLDLKGGIYIVLEVDLPTLVTTLAINKDAKFERTVNEVRNILAENPQQEFFTVFTEKISENGLRLPRYYDVDYGAKAEDILNSIREQADDAINRVLEILHNWVDQFGVDDLDDRPIYEDKSDGYLKIRHMNQAIIVRKEEGTDVGLMKNVINDVCPDDGSGNGGSSYLCNGFTITMWVRFVGKTGDFGLLFTTLL